MAGHPARLGHPLAEWPGAWRKAWLEGIDGEGFLRDLSRAAGWSVRRRQQAVMDAGRFIAWLAKHRPDALLSPSLLQTLAPALLADFVTAEFARGLRAGTIATALGNVLGVAETIGPPIEEERRRRLWAVADRVRIRARGEPPTVRHFVDPAALYEAGIATMEATLDSEGACRDPDGWQAGLMVALLAAVPIRIANFAALELGQHLYKTDGVWTVDLPAEGTKTQRVDAWPVPAALAPYLDHFVDCLRPGMLTRACEEAEHRRLWVGAQGQPLEHQAVRARIKALTAKAFGRAVLPHSFRHAAATAFFMRHPDRPRDAAALLGHAGFGTTERHYIRSQRAVALEAAQAALRAYREAAAAETEEADKGEAVDSRLQGMCT